MGPKDPRQSLFVSGSVVVSLFEQWENVFENPMRVIKVKKVVLNISVTAGRKERESGDPEKVGQLTTHKDSATQRKSQTSRRRREKSPRW